MKQPFMPNIQHFVVWFNDFWLRGLNIVPDAWVERANLSAHTASMCVFQDYIAVDARNF